jgi:hypothetical protein
VTTSHVSFSCHIKLATFSHIICAGVSPRAADKILGGAPGLDLIEKENAALRDQQQIIDANR